MTTATADGPLLSDFERRLGHPPGLFMLFFAEMWERFSYYGMRALLVFYMTKGFLGYGDTQAYGVYGAYTALVYMTPFLGGMIADRVIGARMSVIIGGLLMGAGHLTMTIESTGAFYLALALLIAGNGFFKPNISTMVGSLYHAHNKERRDGGFTIFYMGINLGAAMAPLLCGAVGEKYGWHYGFGLATIGMLIGVAVFVAPNRITQLLIGSGALASAVGMVALGLKQTGLVLATNVFVSVALVVAAAFAVMALHKDRLPADAGAPPNRNGLMRKLGIVLAGTALSVPLFSVLVQHETWAGSVLSVFGFIAFGFIFYSALTSPKVERERLLVVLVMFFFSMLFWAFFEQAGSSMNNFADRNVDRVDQERVITPEDVGQTLELDLSQEQLGFPQGGTTFTMGQLEEAKKAGQTHVSWTITQEHVGMGVGGAEVPASVFQAVNPVCILLLGLLFSALWTGLAKRKIEPSTPVKFSLGLLQLGLGFGALWLGAEQADSRGMVATAWLILAYVLHTTGELCLSPVGLSMVTKLSPARMVSTVMGGWFLATAFSQYLAGIIAKITGVSHGGEGALANAIPPPLETVHVYGDVFGRIGIAGVVSAVLLAILAPFLNRWMHPEKPMTGEGDAAPAT